MQQRPSCFGDIESESRLVLPRMAKCYAPQGFQSRVPRVCLLLPLSICLLSVPSPLFYNNPYELAVPTSFHVAFDFLKSLSINSITRLYSGCIITMRDTNKNRYIV